VQLDDLSCKRKTDAEPAVVLVGLRVAAAHEHVEDALLELGSMPRAVVAHANGH
jgi:hypothetical protein